MSNTTRTRVSKSSKAIKAIIWATFPTWTGRKVTVIEASPEWEHVQYIDDQTSVMHYFLDSGDVANADRPQYSGSGMAYHRAHAGVAVVMLSRFMGQDMGIEIIIPGGDCHRGAIDSMAVAVAVDALLEGSKARAAAALAPCGDVAGIALALAEARAKSLSKGEAQVASA